MTLSQGTTILDHYWADDHSEVLIRRTMLNAKEWRVWLRVNDIVHDLGIMTADQASRLGQRFLELPFEAVPNPETLLFSAK